MIRYAMIPMLLIAGAVAIPAAEAADQWGNLTGKFVYKGKAPVAAKLDITKDREVCGKHDLVDESLVVGPEGGLANVVIYVRDKKVKVHPDYAKTDADKVRFDNKHCRFTPHVLPVRLTQTLELHNSDTVGHNSNLQPLGDVGQIL